MRSGLKVFAPASVANVACGFDILGFALNHPGDEIVVKFSNAKGLRITKITGDKGKLPKEIDKNTAGFAGKKLLEFLGESDRGIDMEIHKKMPFCSGLGSSAASAVAAVVAINEILKKPLQKRDLLKFAVLGEQKADGAFHCDNVAPSLIGGIVFIRDNQALDIHRIPTSLDLYSTVIHPHVEVLTKDSRNLLRQSISFQKNITQSGNLGGLIIGLYNGDLDLIGRSLQDHIVEEQRAHLIPHFYKLKDAALSAGALGSSISGAGPSVFALSANSLIAENIGDSMSRVLKNHGIEHDLYISMINKEGAVLL